MQYPFKCMSWKICLLSPSRNQKDDGRKKLLNLILMWTAYRTAKMWQHHCELPAYKVALVLGRWNSMPSTCDHWMNLVGAFIVDQTYNRKPNSNNCSCATLPRDPMMMFVWKTLTNSTTLRYLIFRISKFLPVKELHFVYEY